MILSFVSTAPRLGAHSERTPSGYRADTERVHSACEKRGEIQALPRAGSALSKVQSTLRADTKRNTERIQIGYRAMVSGGGLSHMLGARSQKFRAHSERIQSGYRAEVRGGGLQALPQAWSAISKVQSALHPSGYRADSERIQSGGAEDNCPTPVRSDNRRGVTSIVTCVVLQGGDIIPGEQS